MERVDLHTYLINALNEAENDNVQKSTFNNSFLYDENKPENGIKIKDNKNYKKYLNKFDKKNKDWIYTTPNGNEIKVADNTLKSALEKYNKQTKEKNSNNRDNTPEVWNENKFKDIGRAFAYRSSLGVASNPDNIQQLVRDVLEDESDYSIKQIENISDIIIYGAAVKTINNIKNREKNDKNVVDKCNKALEEIQNEDTRNSIIRQIKKDYNVDYDKYKRQYQQAFEDGLKEQRIEMSKKDYDWKDPITGLPPKGKLANLNKFFSKGMAGIENTVNTLKSKIPSQHTLENDMARLALLGVTAMLTAGKGIKSLFGLFRSNRWKSGKNIKGFKEEASLKKIDIVKKAINDYKKKFNEWKNTKNESFITEAEEQKEDKKRKELLEDFNKLMYDEIIKYYFGKILNISSSFSNEFDNYIVKETDGEWNTKNSPSGNITYIEDNCILMTNFLNYLKDELSNILLEFQNESIKNVVNSIPNEVFYDKTYGDEFNKWCNNLKTDYGFIKFLNVYNGEVINKPKTFKTYKEFIDYINNSITLLSKVSKVSTLNNTKLEFKNNITVNVPGIITENNEIQNDTEETEEEEQTEETNDELKSKLENITKELEELKNINGNSDKLVEIENLSKKLEDIDTKIQSTYNDLWKIVNTKDNKAEFDKYKVDEHTPMFQKIINVKAIMSKLGIMESVALEEIKQLLLEDTNNKELDKVKKELKNLLDKKFEDSDLEKYNEIKNELNKLDDVQKEIKEKPELVLALNDNEDKTKSQEYINQTKDILDDINIENISKKEFYDELKAKFDKMEDGILDWCKNNEYRLKLYTDHKLPEDIENEIIPKIWNAENFLRNIVKPLQTDSYNPFYEYDFIMLLEDEQNKEKKQEEIANKIKNGCEAIKKMLTIVKENDFINQYKEWKKSATELFNQFGDKIENKDQIKDPIQMMTSMCLALKKANEGGENNQNNQENGGENQEG